jgi:hypothetical protein
MTCRLCGGTGNLVVIQERDPQDIPPGWVSFHNWIHWSACPWCDGKGTFKIYAENIVMRGPSKDAIKRIKKFFLDWNTKYPPISF